MAFQSPYSAMHRAFKIPTITKTACVTIQKQDPTNQNMSISRAIEYAFFLWICFFHSVHPTWIDYHIRIYMIYFFYRTVHRFTYAKQIFGLNIWLKFIKATCAHIRIISNLLRWNNERKKTVEFALEHLGVCCLLSWTIETTTTANVKYHKHNTYNKPPPKNSVTTLNVGARAKKRETKNSFGANTFCLRVQQIHIDFNLISNKFFAYDWHWCYH